ncbi:Homocysteine S-methyltransferase [Baffinella frigidus]|nr:Homocysteine S-methyltransferase [Cryptophyta sp. CCMP2293]
MHVPTYSSWLLVAVGVNCTAPQHITPLLGILRGQPLPLLTYPNKGEEWDAAARAFLPGTATSDDVFCEQAAEWIAAGAKAVGGCCRTTPDTIRALRATLRKE